ncbi:multiprotein-bridging factor 1 [Mycoemilia scoparia]|uniref:Multiprotein-bridging factor 1 n=1 Tax=Mycoemilia scoparia TaxID=417184 RepID=A0A9W7ZYR2_9FUNG|nr:multiprotein-bridging factor 1 [Mycoemilia scoparia]
MSETNWDSVTVLRKAPARQKKVTGSEANDAMRMGFATTEKRSLVATNTSHHVNTDHQRIAKLDRENDIAAPKKVSLTTSKAIQQARQDKGMTQKDLAQKINEKPSVINEYEAGKAIPNQQTLGKLERALGVKLRGANVGEPLHKSKPKK